MIIDVNFFSQNFFLLRVKRRHTNNYIHIEKGLITFKKDRLKNIENILFFEQKYFDS
jgi:hypothetical protein